jgi:hypothetical protein
MKSIFSKINESEGKRFLTHAIQQYDVARLALTAAIIYTHFINPKEWKRCKSYNGSLTFQHKKDAHKVIKIFVDMGNTLAIENRVFIDTDPIVVGIELSTWEPFSREAVRNQLGAMSPHRYMDPRKGHPKYFVVPQTEHFYDILFLTKTPRSCPVKDEVLKMFVEIVDKGMEEEKFVGKKE